jgi:hypothetical protein
VPPALARLRDDWLVGRSRFGCTCAASKRHHEENARMQREAFVIKLGQNLLDKGCKSLTRTCRSFRMRSPGSTSGPGAMASTVNRWRKAGTAEVKWRRKLSDFENKMSREGECEIGDRNTDMGTGKTTVRQDSI